MKELVVFESMCGLILAFQVLVICEVIETALFFGWGKVFYFPHWDDIVFGGFYMAVAMLAPVIIWAMVTFAKNQEEIWGR